MQTKKHKASILVVALIILGIVLVAVISILSVSVKEQKSSIGASKSTQAYQTAETGVEILTDAILKSCHAKINTLANCNPSTKLIEKSNYAVELFDKDNNKLACDDSTHDISIIAFIKSIGTAPGQAQRAIETSVNNGLADCTGTIDVDGVTYGKVLAEDCRCWLDRNLGATEVATTDTGYPNGYDDPAAYGWLFQWGRKADGHQKTVWGSGGVASNVTVSAMRFDADEVPPPYTDEFIRFRSDWGAPFDWHASPQNNTFWQGVGGVNNPCPIGFRVPTSNEWDNLAEKANIYDANSAFDSKLKFTTAGTRLTNNGSFASQGGVGGYWTSTVYDDGGGYYSSGGWVFSTGSGPAYVISAEFSRNQGKSVRCIKN